MADDKMREMHEEGIQATLGKLGVLPNEETFSVGTVALRDLLQEVFDLRWQNRTLQARGTELVEEGRTWKRKAKEYGDMIAFLGRCIGEPVNRKAILARCPERFDDAEARLDELRRRFPHLFKDIPYLIEDSDG